MVEFLSSVRASLPSHTDAGSLLSITGPRLSSQDLLQISAKQVPQSYQNPRDAGKGGKGVDEGCGIRESGLAFSMDITFSLYVS